MQPNFDLLRRVPLVLGIASALHFANAESAEYSATLQRTSHGVVHVTANDFRGIGFGVGYAYATDNHCLLAHRVAQVNGRLSEQLGADADIETPLGGTRTALESDRYHLGWFDINAIRDGFNAGGEEVRHLAEGYAAGVNRHLSETPHGLNCQVEFSRDLTVDDVYRMWVATTDLPSFELLSSYLPDTHPGNTSALANLSNYATAGLATPDDTPIGSNAWAFGRDATQSGGGLHFYNPHFPWQGINRLYMIHVTVPGRLNVMGAALGGFPIPLAGFTERLAWGLTVSAATRFTIAELKLKAGNPLTYLVDGAEESIVRETISIPVKGEANPRQVPFYRAPTGPVINAPAFFLNWSAAKAYAVQDVNQHNTRMVEQALRVAMANDVNELRDSLETVQGNPWSYITASDVNGDVLFADISAMPDVDAARIESCKVSFLSDALRGAGVFLLNGSKSSCRWHGRMQAAQQPLLIRGDYAANSNNNYELPNLNAPLSGYSPMFGAEGQALGLRASLGLRMIEDRLSGIDGRGVAGFNADLIRQIFHQDRNLGAEILVDGIVDDCRANPVGIWNKAPTDLSAVCNALAAWDLRQTVASRGAHVFNGLIVALDEQNALNNLFETAADFNAPLTTPAGYSANASLRQTVRNALARVSQSLDKLGISPDAAWGEVNKVNLSHGSFGLPGGDGAIGVFDVLTNNLAATNFAGWETSLSGVAPQTLFGTSYMHVVALTAQGPVASGLMPYSQASEAGSPWYLDQVPALSGNAWFSFPFSPEAIAADPNLSTMRLSSGTSLAGEVDGDNDVDQADLNLLLAARNQTAGSNDPRDLDKNGVINVLDSRKLAQLCSRPRCVAN
ncbi:MAG: penicillin acylase family protein [Methylomonas sp.]|nr:penicillin acylase family protein [Methylomonas sp.]